MDRPLAAGGSTPEGQDSRQTERGHAPGVRLVSNLVDGEPAIGLPVEVVFEEVSPEVTLPRFRVRTP